MESQIKQFIFHRLLYQLTYYFRFDLFLIATILSLTIYSEHDRIRLNLRTYLVLGNPSCQYMPSWDLKYAQRFIEA